MKRGGLFDKLSVGLFGMTLLTLACYLIVLINPTVAYNPFPPPPTQTPTVYFTPTNTIPPTWTPTSTFTPAASPTPAPTRTPTPHRTPTASPTWPPTRTPTPRATRSPYPFTCEIIYRRPEYEGWSGVAGHFQNMDEEPLPGYHAQTECPGVGVFTHRAGDNTRFNMIYDNEAAWEQACNPAGYQPMEIRVQMFNNRPGADGTYRAVSELMRVELGGYASRSLGYVVCTLNWENW